MAKYMCSDGQTFDSVFDAQLHQNLLNELGRTTATYVMGISKA